MAHVAYILTGEYGVLSFDSGMLKDIYEKIHAEHGLPNGQSLAVIEEIESHNGLLVTGGYDQYEFAHKSFQEFLAADYIVRLPSLAPLAGEFWRLPNELAIATSLSSKPGMYLCEVINKARGAKLVDSVWYTSYANRLVMERAELTIGHTVFSTISVLQLLTRCHDRYKITQLLRRMIPKDAVDSLSTLYRVVEKNGGFFTLRQRPNVRQQDLPEELEVPVELLRNDGLI